MPAADPHATLEFVPHQRRRGAKTDAIVRTALRLLVADGLEGMTLQRVARELGLATTALYRYFPSKDALLAAMQRQAVLEVHAALRARLEALGPALARRAPAVAALARVLAVARFYQELPRTHAETYHLVAVLLGDPRPLIADEHAAGAVPLLVAVLGEVADLLGEVTAAGGFDPGDEAARALALWSTLHGVNQLAKLARLAPAPPERGAVGRLAVRALVRGFGAPAGLVRHAEQALDQIKTRGGATR